MDAHKKPGHTTRLIFFGEQNLADGFRLIGFEVYPDPKPAAVDQVLRDLRRNREYAIILLDDEVMNAPIPNLKSVLGEGGRIVAIAVPQLNSPVKLTSGVAQRIAALFGASTLKNPVRPGSV